MNQTKTKNRKTLSSSKTTAFTMLEMLITMAIAVILATMAVPAFNSLLEGSRLTANTNLVIGALNLARSEAIRLGESVRVEKIANGFQIVIASGINDDKVLKQFSPSNTGITITPDDNVDPITYASTGFRSFDNNLVGDIHVCDSQGNGTDIHISTGGSVSSEESATC